jgi:hypothetical protein
MAIWETGRHPIPVIAAQTSSRLRSLSTPEVFFGQVIQTSASGAADLSSFFADVSMSHLLVAKNWTNSCVPPIASEMTTPSGRGASDFK